MIGTDIPYYILLPALVALSGALLQFQSVFGPITNLVGKFVTTIGILAGLYLGWSHFNASNERSKKQQETILLLQAKSEPRVITYQTAERIVAALAPFKDAKVSGHAGAVPESGTNLELARALVDILSRKAGHQVTLNQVNVKRWVLDGPGPVNAPSGVTFYYVGGNERGKSIATTLSAVLNEAGIDSSTDDQALLAEAEGERAKLPPEQRGSLNDKAWSQIRIVVGDRSKQQ